jgi:glutathione S-transferase
MKLHYTDGSPYARKVRIVLLEKGLTFEPAKRDGVPLTAPWPGPTRAIPVLEDQGTMFWESDLIVDYLLKTYPDARAATDTPPLSPWLARPDRHWEDMKTLATIATCAASMINLRFLFVDGIGPENSDYLTQQKARIEECLDWLEDRVTDEGFAPGWFSIMDIAFICPMDFAETRGVMNWRGRKKLDALFDRYRSRPSLLATPLNPTPPLQPRYTMERRPAGA